MSSLPATTHNSISNAWREGSALQRNAGTIGIRIYQLLCVRLAVVVDRHLLYVRYGTDRRHNRRIGWQQMVPVPVLLVVRTCNGTTVPTTQVSCRCPKKYYKFFCYILTVLTFLFSDTDFFLLQKIPVPVSFKNQIFKHFKILKKIGLTQGSFYGFGSGNNLADPTGSGTATFQLSAG